MNHVALLHNNTSKRFHPIIFRPSPRPSDDVKIGKLCRHRSSGHHTEGFCGKDEALDYIASEPGLKLVEGLVYDWSGKDVPATTADLPYLE